MIDDIETSTRCGCGTLVCVGLSSGGGPDRMWQAVCRSCYGPVEDSGPCEEILGYGKTPDAALWAWQEAHDVAWEVEWVPTDMFGDLARQLSEEAERQRAWKTRPQESR